MDGNRQTGDRQEIDRRRDNKRGYPKSSFDLNL